MSFLNFFLNVIKFFDLINKVSGYICATLVCLMTLNVFVVVLLRYLFDISFIWMQETYVWMHAFIFLLGAGFTYLSNEHVRIDIFYRTASLKFKKTVNLIGNIFFLLPFLYLIFYFSFPFVYKSFQMSEVSREAGGLSMLFILKSSILVFVILLTLQVFSRIISDIFENMSNDS